MWLFRHLGLQVQSCLSCKKGTREKGRFWSFNSNSTNFGRMVQPGERSGILVGRQSWFQWYWNLVKNFYKIATFYHIRFSISILKKISLGKLITPCGYVKNYDTCSCTLNVYHLSLKNLSLKWIFIRCECSVFLMTKIKLSIRIPWIKKNFCQITAFHLNKSRLVKFRLEFYNVPTKKSIFSYGQKTLLYQRLSLTSLTLFCQNQQNVFHVKMIT